MAVERAAGGSSLIDVLDRVLDKGIVIDAWVRVSLVGIDLITVEARVVARGGGTINAYKEPSGPGVRVDACGYLGYAPPPQFDPLLMPEMLHSIYLDQSGHFPMLDETQRFNRLLTDWLALESGESPRDLQLKEEWRRRVR